MLLKRLFSISVLATLLAGSVLPYNINAQLDLGELPQHFYQKEYYIDSFVASAYYSPLPNQPRYVTGSLESDIRLNGRGTNGASGKQVFPGMLACPSKYPFGTGLYIPGFGFGICEDRGGAIVASDASNSRGYDYDRIDLWLGRGYEGMTAALRWGKRTVHNVLVYPPGHGREAFVYYDIPQAHAVYVSSPVTSPLKFKSDLFFGNTSALIKEMQEHLVTWGYLSKATGFYGDETARAIFDFQLDFEIVSSEDDKGAGHFGINTRTTFDTLIKDGVQDETLAKKAQARRLVKDYPDLIEDKPSFSATLSLKDSGDSVRELQKELQSLGFLRIEPTGYFGEVTEHAVFKFQQAHNIVERKDELGAGVFGPQTRAMLEGTIEERIEMKQYLAYERSQIEEETTAETNNEVVAAKEED